MLAVKNITKRFAGVTALEDVTLELQKGKVNAVIGENGAGKSTLMKILSGVHQDYEGEIIYKDQSVRFINPRDAQKNGIAIIYQELNLIPQLSVMENIFLGREELTRWGFLDKEGMRAKSQVLLDRLKLFVDPDTPVGELKVGQQQVVEIAKALLTDSEVIIMDEPTSAISESEVEVLFGVIENLREEGKTIVYISHKLEELFKMADRYIVLRDGRVIGSGSMKETDQDDIIRKMAGRNIKVADRQKRETSDTELLSVRDICLKHPVKANSNLLRDITFNLFKGEILGIYGLMGAGRTELLETLFGLHHGKSLGKIFIERQEVVLKSSADAIEAGLALVPEDRKKDGLVLNMDVKTNIALAVLKEIEKFGLISEKKETALADRYIRDLKIKTPSSKQVAQNLSGGNQQKVVLAKWLASNPKILMLDEPTRGIDVNAKNEIYKLILDLAGKGLGLIVVSSEIPEILALSDRILTMSEGVLTAEFKAEDVTEDMLLKASIPKTI
jgi:ribose transport system ATP-binding protein